ncbi:hypothetical protein GT037_008282 [Alternaria burnsii]|uniref:Uncharacterized protein n=1 Tax=Alternaria burnsii TaxID=1187904 RepID=A0A8H7AYG4_9PLEO|nr:uncharacterized protein GT037_008282 [Alternaria burnsii]KAF7673667.1 hypothetical protein GT037_008282 [Alternaria burnsii]
MRRLIRFLDRTCSSLDFRHFRIFPKLLSTPTSIFTIFDDKVDYIAFTSPRTLQDYDSHNLLVDTKTKMDFSTWPSTTCPEGAPQMPLGMSRRRQVRQKEPVHCAVKSSSSKLSYMPGSATSRLPTPRLASPWQWAYVSSNTNPSPRVLAPINQETQEIHPSFYRRFPSALASVPSATQSTPEISYPERIASRRKASQVKCEKWLAIDKPNIPRKGLEQLSLESDEEGWEKVDDDEDWVVVDNPGMEEGQWAQ